MSEKLSSDVVERLMNEHDRLTDVIGELRSAQNGIINVICKSNGSCPQCKNWHYPYCGDE